MARKAKELAFPYQQMTILSICRFAEPVASSSVNPYVPELVASFNVATDRIGMYTGWLSAVFSLSQAVTGIAWGRASDKFARKPMIMLALVTVMIGSVLFGFSTSLAMAFITRSIQGAASGNVGIIRTAVAEMVPQKELQPRAFSVMPLIWNVGSIFGPIIGGFLSNPQRRGWFLHWDLFAKYPFALPNLTISVFFVMGIITGILFLKETHERLRNRKDYGLLLGALLTGSCSRRQKRSWKRDTDEAEPFLDSNGSTLSTPLMVSAQSQSQKPTAQPSWRSIFSRQSTINLVAYTGLAMHSVSFDQLLPVFMHHPIQSRKSPEVHLPLQFAGGFGLNSGQIGVLFTVYGIFGMCVQLFLFPPLARKFGVLNCFKVCALTFPCVYLVIPFTSLLSTSNLRQGICLAMMLVKCAAGIFAFPCSTILLTNSAVSLSVLGTLNGVSTSISAMGRATGPALVGWAFTIGVDNGYVVTPFWTLLAISVAAAIPVWSLIEMEGFSGKTANEEDDEDVQDSSDERQRHRMEDFRSDVIQQTSGLGILDGTEEADLLNDDIPVVKQPATRPTYTDDQVHDLNSSLTRLKSPTELTVPSGLLRRTSTGSDSLHSEMGSVRPDIR